MTVEEKAELLAGASHWRTRAARDGSLRQLVLSDGPHGLRKQEGKEDHLGIAQSHPATCFPAAATLACSFDPDLAREVGAAIGEEARDQGVDVVLGPGVNIKRHPLCGRNFEYFSEDPLLAGELGAAIVEGIQSQGVAACLKHLAGNSQERARLVSDSVIDERTLRELYLAPFERVVRGAHPWSVMSAYNKLNGVYCSENAWLLESVLRGDWGFDGAVVSDWGAVSSVVGSVRAGLDLCMPGPRVDYACTLIDAVKSGELDEGVVDRRVDALKRLAARVDGNVTHAMRDGAFAPSASVNGDPASCFEGEEGPFFSSACATSASRPANSEPAPPSRPSTRDDEELYRRHADLARRVAASSAVLLKNDGTLPIAQDARVAVIGAFARSPRYQGSGSSRINAKIIDNIWYRFEQQGVAAVYADGYDPATGDTDAGLLAEARAVASQCDVAVVVAGLPARYESEGFDRKLMCMPRGMNELIECVCKVNQRTVVVLQGGAPMELPWRDKPAAVLLTYLSGSQGGGAAVDVLLGEVNPSGKLAESWPARLADTALGATYPDMANEVLYREATFVGYRYYDAAGVAPAYPFGHGLSYTQFEYADARAVTVGCAPASGRGANGAPSTSDTSESSHALVVPNIGGSSMRSAACHRESAAWKMPVVTVSFEIANIGSCAGAEVAQVYVVPGPGVVPPPCPVHQLAGFYKIALEPGETRRVSLALDERAFRFWNVERHCWCVNPGRYELRIGSSSRDIRLTACIDLNEGFLRAADGSLLGMLPDAGITADEPPAHAVEADESQADAVASSSSTVSLFMATAMAQRTPPSSPRPHSPLPACYERPTPGCFTGASAQESFRKLYGRPLPEPRPTIPLTIDSTVRDMGACWLGRRLFRLIDWVMAEPARKMDRDQRAMMKEMAADMPLRQLVTSGVPMKSVDGLVAMLNGRYLTGFLKLASGLRRRA